MVSYPRAAVGSGDITQACDIQDARTSSALCNAARAVARQSPGALTGHMIPEKSLSILIDLVRAAAAARVTGRSSPKAATSEAAAPATPPPRSKRKNEQPVPVRRGAPRVFTRVVNTASRAR